MKKYFYVLNRIFHKLNYREKFLLLLFTSTLTFIWFMSACQQTKTLVQNWHTINTKIKQDRFWIRNESIVKANLRKVLDVMDPGKTLSGAAFRARSKILFVHSILTTLSRRPRPIKEKSSTHTRCNFIVWEPALVTLSPSKKPFMQKNHI